MKTTKLLRTLSNDKETLGAWSVTDSRSVLMVAKTLELPDKNNEHNISCILPGKYICKYTKSESFSKAKGFPVYTYEITHVPGRGGVRIHSANFFSELRGCISVGDAFKDINADGQLDIIHSGDTVKRFEQLMNYEDFELEIIKAY